MKKESYASTQVCDISVDEINFENELNLYERNVLYYIAGWIQNSLFRSLKSSISSSIDSNLAHLKNKFYSFIYIDLRYMQKNFSIHNKLLCKFIL
jgi:hypothetical protein